ncbi:MAG TPA: MlaD family protein [Acetobacteraceae bacterium]|nr:MlaD family protein [Acetobacteraceae bacterium]
MSDEPKQAVEHTSRWPGWIWAVPIAAVAIVAYLAFQQLAASGPDVTVIFPTGGGIEADNTKVKWEGIVVGQVASVRFMKDMRHVRAMLSMNSDMDGHLGKGTRFWISGHPGITNLASLKSALTGPFIGVEPHPGPKQKRYQGLAERPPEVGGQRVTRYVLQADRLGTITRGSPVYYRDLQVGVVGGARLESDNRHFRIELFINAPFNDLVHEGTRFWNASAVQISMANGGPRLQFQSVPALFQGAVDFETPRGAQSGPPANAGAMFPLYGNAAAAEHAPAPEDVLYRVVFQAEEGGALNAGAPVTLDQKRIGSVTESTLQYDPRTGQLQDLVTLAIEPDDIVLAGGNWAAYAKPQMDAMLRRLIGEGLRARLGSSIPVVGGKAVQLAFVPHARQASLGEGAIPEIPAGPESSVNSIMASLSAVAVKLNAMPLDRIADNVHQATKRVAALTKSPQLTASLRHLDESLANIEQVTRSARVQAGPVLADLRRVAFEAQGTLADMRQLVSSNPLSASAEQPETASMGHTLYELSRAARSLRELTDYLDRNPQALLMGKR